MDLNAKLTKRQHRIVFELWRGLQKKEIASLLKIAINTVDNHCRNIYERLGINSSIEAVHWWYAVEIKVPINELPEQIRAKIKDGTVTKNIIALMFLTISISADLVSNFDAIRSRSKTRTSNSRGVRARRVREY